MTPEKEKWEGIEGFKFWLYELDEKELLESRESIIKNVESLLSTERKEMIEDVKEKVRNLSKKNFGSNQYKEIYVKWDEVEDILDYIKNN